MGSVIYEVLLCTYISYEFTAAAAHVSAHVVVQLWILHLSNLESSAFGSISEISVFFSKSYHELCMYEYYSCTRIVTFYIYIQQQQ